MGNWKPSSLENLEEHKVYSTDWKQFQIIETTDENNTNFSSPLYNHKQTLFTTRWFLPRTKRLNFPSTKILPSFLSLQESICIKQWNEGTSITVKMCADVRRIQHPMGPKQVLEAFRAEYIIREVASYPTYKIEICKGTDSFHALFSIWYLDKETSPYSNIKHGHVMSDHWIILVIWVAVTYC